MSESHEHNNSHTHSHALTDINRAFIIGIILNGLFVAIEFLVGFHYSSLALISDAGHNLTDVFGLLIALLAFKAVKLKGNKNFTYGYKKTTILASLVNAVILLITIGGIFWEGINRLKNPQPVEGGVISAVALVGIAINSVSAFLFFKDKKKDINIRGAYLHLMGDAVISFGVVIAGLVIVWTHIYWLDIAVSFIISILILISTWKLLTESIRLVLDGIPVGIEIDKIQRAILTFKEVTGVHHVHIWPLSSSENALTAHLVIRDSDITKFELVKNKIKNELEHLNIQHTTFEIEYGNCSDGKNKIYMPQDTL
jgi:cobalt-zinc-cadmium efflux system protein